MLRLDKVSPLAMQLFEMTLYDFLEILRKTCLKKYSLI